MPADDTHRIVFLDRETLAPEVSLRRPAFEQDWWYINEDGMRLVNKVFAFGKIVGKEK